MLLKKIRYYKRKYQNLYDVVFGKQIIHSNKHASPDFMIIGTQKGGTTSLFQYLGQHPETVPPNEKELAYFAWNSGKGLNWYLKNFPLKSKKGDKLTYEATPAYIFLDECPRKIKRLYPDLKFILILRDPVMRAYSHWNFYHDSTFIKERQYLKELRSFEDAINDELSGIEPENWEFRYLSRGFYAKQLKNWYRYFDKEQILILDSSDLKKHPQEVMRKVTDFLNILPYFDEFKFGVGNVDQLVDTISKQDMRVLKNFNTNQYKSKINSDTKDALYEFFKSHNKELEDLTGMTFSWMLD